MGALQQKKGHQQAKILSSSIRPSEADADDWASFDDDDDSGNGIDAANQVDKLRNNARIANDSSLPNTSEKHPASFSSIDAIDGPRTTIEKFADSFKRARLRLVKGGNSKQLWVHRATSMKPGLPKPKYVRKLIIDAWETGSLTGWHKHVVHRPLTSHQMVALKSLIVVETFAAGPT